MLIAFRLGYIQATCNRILAKVDAAMQANSTAPPTPSGPMKSRWTKTKERLSEFVLLSKVLHALRNVPWGLLTALGYGALKWLGLF